MQQISKSQDLDKEKKLSQEAEIQVDRLKRGSNICNKNKMKKNNMKKNKELILTFNTLIDKNVCSKQKNKTYF